MSSKQPVMNCCSCQLLKIKPAVLVFLLCCHPAAAEQITVWESGHGGYHTYRIPSVIRTPASSLLAFCEGRLSGRGDAGNIDLLIRRSEDGGKTWSDQHVVWDDGLNTCGNPCPVVDQQTGTIWLLLTHNHGPDHETDIIRKKSVSTRTVWVSSSHDDGLTWAKPRNITDTTKDPAWGWYATGPGVGIQLKHGPHQGRLVIPCDHSYDDPAGSLRGGPYGFGAHIIYSDDHGSTWQLGGVIRPHTNECQVVELSSSGGLLMNSRSYFGRGKRTQSRSHDGGLTWQQPMDQNDLPEPVCQGSIIRHRWPSGTDHPGAPDQDVANARGMLLFSNPADGKQRIRLTVSRSLNDGQSWQPLHVLHAGPAAYSCLVSLDTDTAGCLYEAGEKSPYEHIVFETFSVIEESEK